MKIQRDEYDERFSRLSGYLDGALAADENASIEQALATDEALRAELDVLQRVDALVRASAEAPPELDWPAFAAHVRAARAGVAVSRAGMRWRRLLAPLAAAAVLAMVVTAGVLWQHTEHERRAASERHEIAVVSIERHLVRSEPGDAAVASLVQLSHAAPAGEPMGPPRPRRTLVVSVASISRDSGNGQLEEDAGYF